MTITKKFGDAFDPLNEKHVMYLKKLHESLDERKMAPVFMDNPFGIKVNKNELLDAMYVQFILSMKYAIAVINGKAWIPPQGTPSQ